MERIRTLSRPHGRPRVRSGNIYTNQLQKWMPASQKSHHYDGKALSFNPGLQYPHLHGPVHTPDNNRWDTPPV